MSAIPGGELFQKSLYAGISLENILYGLELALYFETMYKLLNPRVKRKTSDVFYAIFSTVMLLMVSIWVSAQVIFGGNLWLPSANPSSGPGVFWAANGSLWYIFMAVTAVMILQLMTDALMIYRCWAVWGNYRVIAVPLILWLLSLVLGVLACWTSSAKGGFFFRDITEQIGLAYFCVSVFLTAMLTCLICYRVLWHCNLVKKHLEHKYASPYIAIAAVVVESMLPYTLSGVAFVISLGVGSRTMATFGCVYVLMMCVAPQSLILRVAADTAWTSETSKQSGSAIEFRLPREDTGLV